MANFDDFKHEKFNVDWLLNYSDQFIDVLVRNEARKKFMLEKLDDKMNKSYKNIFTKYFNIYKRLT